MKIALVYDHLNKKGGAEEILQSLSELYPSSPWYTSVHAPQELALTRAWKVIPSFLNKLPFFRTRHELIPFLMPFAFESFDFRSYDLVISVGSMSKGIITGAHTLHVNYCLTPTRWLWSHSQAYLDNNQFGTLQKLVRPLLSKILASLRRWDSVASTRPDEMISISQHVKSRVKRYYHRDSVVIYPPVDTKKFEMRGIVPKISNYYLVVSRLVPYKNIDLVVRAFKTSKRPLVVVGTGVLTRKLKQLAGENIFFPGFVSDLELVGFYQHARAFIQANEEDFGIGMCEALSAGVPVIAYNGGGAREVVTNGQNGLLFNSIEPQSLNQAVDSFETMNFVPSACKASVHKFDKVQWKHEFEERIATLCQKHNQK